MEEPNSDEDESEEEEEEEKEAEEEDTPEAKAGEDDGVAAGVDDGGALPAASDKDADEYVFNRTLLTVALRTCLPVSKSTRTRDWI